MCRSRRRPTSGSTVNETARKIRKACYTVVTLVVLITAGCAHGLQEKMPGQLISAPEEFPISPATENFVQKAMKIRYRSTSGIDGSATDVSGVVFVPKGEAPSNGWPIASIGHPTTGLNQDCAPSTDPSAYENMPAVVSFLMKGFVVVVSDYQGLGMPGLHPYLDPKTVAYNVIDAARAARQTTPGTSDTWVAYGFSQGGQAAWAANEMSAEYGAGLRLVGSVSLSPPTDLRPMVDALEDGTLSIDQIVLLPLILKGIQAAHPELKFDDYLHGAISSNIAVFFSCSGDHENLKTLIAKTASPADYKPATPEAAEKLRNWLGDYSLPGRHAPRPMLVVYGDSDPILRAAWTVAGLRRACELGDIVDVHVMAGLAHDAPPGQTYVDWLLERLAGIPSSNYCAVT